MHINFCTSTDSIFFIRRNRNIFEWILLLETILGFLTTLFRIQQTYDHVTNENPDMSSTNAEGSRTRQRIVNASTDQGIFFSSLSNDPDYEAKVPKSSALTLGETLGETGTSRTASHLYISSSPTPALPLPTSHFTNPST